MAFRVYDTKTKKWLKDNIYLSPDDDLFLIKQSLFGMVKVPLVLHSDRYTYHRDIGLFDSDNVLIFEGDYIKAQVEENKAVIGIVAYARELSAYVILCVDSDEFYTLGSEICDLIEVIGNVFDGYTEDDNQNGEQTL